MEKMFNNNTKRLCAALIIALIAITTHKTSLSGSPEPRSKEAVIENYGTIAYADTPLITPHTRAPPSSGIDSSLIVAVFSFLLALAGAIGGLVKWLQWRAKYGECRTPIFIRISKKRHLLKPKPQ